MTGYYLQYCEGVMTHLLVILILLKPEKLFFDEVLIRSIDYVFNDINGSILDIINRIIIII